MLLRLPLVRRRFSPLVHGWAWRFAPLREARAPFARPRACGFASRFLRGSMRGRLCWRISRAMPLARPRIGGRRRLRLRCLLRRPARLLVMTVLPAARTLPAAPTAIEMGVRQARKPLPWWLRRRTPRRCSGAWRRRLFARAMWLPCAGGVASWTPRSVGPSARFAVSLMMDRREAPRISKGMGTSLRPMWSVGIVLTWQIGRCRRSPE